MHVVSATRRARPVHDAHRLGFLRHLLEMALAMMVGMMTSAAVYLTVTGTTVDVALQRHAVLFVIVQASGMTLAMVAWMRYRGHAWVSCSEMSAAMVVPAVALIALRLLHVISGPICGVYCLATAVAMVLLMLYRRTDYDRPAAAAAADST